MNILDTLDDLDAFRSAVRDWLAAEVPHGWRKEVETHGEARFVEIQKDWMARRARVGLATPHWPKGEGGIGLPLDHQVVLADEFARADAPPLPAFTISLNHLPATLGRWGTEEQRRQYLPRVAEGAVWCQGFSEPSAGSDLASLRTRAERDGDDYVINGQKIWSSFAPYAEFCILLARTSTEGRKQEGISFFLLDMKAPGVEVRRIRQATGRAEFSEMFLTDVRIPASHLVGGEGNGWAVAQSTLTAERGVIAFEGNERIRYALEGYLQRSIREGAAWMQDAELRRDVMSLVAETQAVRRVIRKLLRVEGGQAEVALLSAIVKFAGTEVRQRMYDLAVRLTGMDAMEEALSDFDMFDKPMYSYINSFAGTIAGGTNEIMRNIIAERGLGLPREPSPPRPNPAG